MHPPDAPEVNVAVNGTLISWSESIPRPENIQFVDFNVQIRPQAEPWEKAYSLLTAECWIREASERFAGLHQVRVRVRPGDIQISHWSNWSPTVSWVGPISKDGTLDLMWIWGLTPLLAVVLAVILVLVGVRIRVRSRKLPKKQIPNPSKYFHVLHSVHGSNFKNWLNPLPASQSFYMTKQCEHISPIQLCENKAFDAAPPTLPLTGSTSALLHCKACSLTGSDTSRPLDNDCSSSSSSFYSNMGYFLTSSSGISARSDPNPAYFTYQANSNSWQDDHNSLHLLCGPSVTGGHYESLKREPQSPDSGFCGDKVAEEEKNERVDVNDWKSLDLPHQHCPLDPTLPPPPPPFPDVLPLAEEPLDCPSAATPAADVAGGSYAAWPSAGSVARPSSVSVEANLSKTGYLTVKELQMTFRNKSI